MILREYIKNSPPNWDSDLKDRGDLLQTTYWAAVLHKLDKSLPIFLELYDGSKKIAQLLVFHCIPWDRSRQEMRKDLVGRVMRKGYLRVYGAPVFFYEEEVLINSGTGQIIEWMESYSKSKKLRYIDISGHFNQNFCNIDILESYEKKKWATLLVDLTVDEDQIWRSISGAARKSVNKAKREKIFIKKISNVEEYINLYLQNYNQFNGRETLEADIENNRIIWEEDKNQYYHYYVAQKDNCIIGVLGMFVFNGIAAEIMSALSPEAFEKKLPAQDLLHWEMFLEAKRMGCHTFDLAGINPEPKTAKENGIRRFKEKWNGAYVEYYSYSKITQPILRKAYVFYKRIKKARARG
ncbi:MAG: peptidoglycan bridge formation glycyltransferase FemA/FemB family protein [Eubacteriales bacterium]|nr:peptidoglycan bridge formation glycyltransferase FemA/FemB family protein [Eubacteriales bacterium]